MPLLYSPSPTRFLKPMKLTAVAAWIRRRNQAEVHPPTRVKAEVREASRRTRRGAALQQAREALRCLWRGAALVHARPNPRASRCKTTSRGAATPAARRRPDRARGPPPNSQYHSRPKTPEHRRSSPAATQPRARRPAAPRAPSIDQLPDWHHSTPRSAPRPAAAPKNSWSSLLHGDSPGQASPRRRPSVPATLGPELTLGTRSLPLTPPRQPPATRPRTQDTQLHRWPHLHGTMADGGGENSMLVGDKGWQGLGFERMGSWECEKDVSARNLIGLKRGR
jgi:hypothetical protein